MVLGRVGYIGWRLYPQYNPLPLPLPLISSTSEKGMERLLNAEALADYEKLSESFQAQALISYCGVASSVSVLNAMGRKSSQYDFFNSKASDVRSQFNVMFGGMSLSELAGLLDAHGLKVSINHIDKISVDEFRVTIEQNLANSNDYLIVNYQREVLGQGRVGHISPLAAYDRDTDSVLIMDTAAHKYPHTWVPLTMLYNAMKTTDRKEIIAEIS